MGGIVMYVLDETRVRPAIIVNVRERTVDLVVFTCGAEDLRRSPCENAFNVPFDPAGAPGTYHLPTE